MTNEANRELDQSCQDARELDELRKNKHLDVQFRRVKISIPREGGFFIGMSKTKQVKLWLSQETLVFIKPIPKKIWVFFSRRSHTPLRSSPGWLLQIIRAMCRSLAVGNFLLGLLICFTFFAVTSSSGSESYQALAALLQFILLTIVCNLYWAQAEEISTELANRSH